MLHTYWWVISHICAWITLHIHGWVTSREIARVYACATRRTCMNKSWVTRDAWLIHESHTRLFCKRALLKRRYSAKETYNLIDPTNRSHPTAPCAMVRMSHVAHICMSHVAHIWMSHVACIWMSHVAHIWMSHVAQMRMSHITQIWMSHVIPVWLSHVAHMWLSHVAHVWICLVSHRHPTLA